ncbi:zinc finger protein 880-like [Cloeon dipterum]|uniref:zinc finger protein 880-like n=1 Tax=Cloeon dipterum TaxID=197152 RepID=UPI0032207E14
MPLVKPLCRVCERPTADGAVQAVQLDKEKLQTWLLNVCGHEFAEEIGDEDLICYFCIWHAEFLAPYVSEHEALAWWPPDLAYLDDKAKELRRKYLEGKAEQCWVQLEKIKLPKSVKDENGENEAKTDGGRSGRKCFYCRKMVADIGSHMRYMHANAIRCDYRKCATYFHTVEEKESHTKEVHQKSKAEKLFKCNFCEKEFRRSNNVRQHIRRVHAEFPVKCNFFGCFCYFKSEPEMMAHFDSVHKEEDKAKVFNCHHCEFKSKSKGDLSRHVSRLHFPMKIECGKCHKIFSTKQHLAQHVRQSHETRVCSICNSEVIVGNMGRHLNRMDCTRCKKEFECSGLYQFHLKICKQTLLKCQNCPKTFQTPFQLKYHEKMKHRNYSWLGLKYKNLGFKCESCKRYYKSEKQLKIHLNHFHKRLNLKHCAHCPKSFTDFVNLKNHLAMTHFLIERKFECDQSSQQTKERHSGGLHARSSSAVSCGPSPSTTF